MFRNLYTRLILILIIAALAIWVDASQTLNLRNPLNNKTILQRDVKPRLGLDLRGGMQVLMEADLPIDTQVSADAMEVARTILENRTNALGVAENSIQVAGERLIVGEFPGLEDSSVVLETIQQTGLLEFVDFGSNPLPEGTVIETDFGTGQEDAVSQPSATLQPTDTPQPTNTPQPTDTPQPNNTPEATATAAPTEATPTPEPVAQTPTVYHTVMTGRDLKTINVTTGQMGDYIVALTFTPEGTRIFGDYTTNHVDQFLGIVLDKQVISAPRVTIAITEGEGYIEGSFTQESANALAVQLRYGSLPIPLKIVETRFIGPTLGEDSLQKSLIAGAAGMIIIILFMLLYYRLPGLVANLSILFYGVIAFAIFKYFHFTLTLPGIAGFMLSTGAALDANILIFERLKEELRSGRPMEVAVEQGWKRAWPSIRDSNIAAIITSLILFWFGNTFGATIVKGFSVTLALGVIVSLFTAIFVTRTLLSLILGWSKPRNLEFWFGI